ncbi:MAG: hypothetical protein AAGI28_01905 [Pseudomonadota bacterium]
MANALPKIGILVFLLVAYKAAENVFFHLELAGLGFGTMSASDLAIWFIQESFISIAIFGASLFAIIKLVGVVFKKESKHKPNYDLALETTQVEDIPPASNFDADEAFARYMNRKEDLGLKQSNGKAANTARGFGRKET